ncbi:MAG: 50S ribosomal protein L14P [Promethearchaeota archaeon CR_4]|nr:ribosomal protein L14 [uncultured bacterium]OLS16164.1 MAG: 50S ribosomal protein L14P [Candidatus Lokiarchaeota archaeon CR_4]
MGKRRKTGKKTLIFRPYITRGIGIGAKVKIADNSGAKEGKLIGVMHLSTRLNRFPAATVGDIVTLSIRKGTPEMRRQKLRGIIVRQKQFIHRPDGTRIQFEDNAAVIVTPDGEPKGSEIRGPIAKEATDLHPRLAGVASIII